MKYMIAVDGGGTKTESVLMDETGHICGRDIVPSVNALDVGMACAQERLKTTIDRLYSLLPSGGKLNNIYGGVAACADYFPGVLDAELFPRLPECTRIRMEGDGGCMIAAMQGHSEGCCLISGTGSTLYIRSGEKLQRYGGWGHLIDTGGSGYTIGRDAFLAAFRSFDGRGPKSILYDLIREQMGMAPEAHVPYIYEGGRPYIASFAGTVFQARKLGDRAAEKIFNHAVCALTELIEMGDRVLQKPFTVITGGGILTNFPEFEEAIRERIPAHITLRKIDNPPILGAAIEALWDAGIADNGEFRKRFMEDYRNLVGNAPGSTGGEDCRYDKIYNR